MKLSVGYDDRVILVKWYGGTKAEVIINLNEVVNCSSLWKLKFTEGKQVKKQPEVVGSGWFQDKIKKECLIVGFLWLEIGLRVFACRAFHRRFFAFDYVTAIPALPFDVFFAFEHFARFYPSQ